MVVFSYDVVPAEVNQRRKSLVATEACDGDSDGDSDGDRGYAIIIGSCDNTGIKKETKKR